MLPARDRFWLTGEASWYPASDEVPSELAGEAFPGEEWTAQNSAEGMRGWMRQRLEPLGPRLLLTTSWAPFFLVMSVATLLSRNPSPNTQNIAAVLFAISWALLLIPFMKVRDVLPNRATSSPIDFYPFDSLFLVFGAVTFGLHILVDTRIGWLSILFFAIAQYRTIRNFTVCAGRNSARWLLPIQSTDYSPSVLASGWKADSKVFRNGPLAHWEGPLPEYAADLIGVTRGDSTFVAFTLKHRGGTLHDPFSEHLVTDSAFEALLASPPLLIGGEAWPDRFHPNYEQ